MSDYDDKKLAELRDLRVHIFIQWLEHKDALDEWLEEVLTQHATDDLLTHAVFIMRAGTNIINRSMTMHRSVKGMGYWAPLNEEWVHMYRDKRVQHRLKRITGWGDLS